MKLGTSLRFLYPTGPQTYERFKEVLASLPPGGFVERPMGAFDTAEQSRNVLEIAVAAREAGLDSLLFGDNHAVSSAYANCFSAVPTVARLMAVTGSMPVGMVLLAPFYQPIVLAEQIGTLAAFAQTSLIITLDGVSVSPRPRVPMEIWLAGTVPAAAERAGTLGDGWLTGQNVTDDELVRQLDIYREA